MKPIRDKFGSDRAVRLTPGRVRRFIDERLDAGKAHATVNRETGALRQALRLALKEGRLTRVAYIPMLTEDNARQGFVEAAAFANVVKNLPEPVNEIARFAFLSCWRKGEILPLRWDAVDRNVRERKGEVRLRTPKNSHPRMLPLTGELWDLIERRWQARQYKTADGLPAISEYVFHGGNGRLVVDFKRSWPTACTKAGRPDLLFHDLRRSAVRNMVRADVDRAVAMISGHRTRSIFDRYNIVSEADMTAALEKTQARVKAQAAEPAQVAAGEFRKAE